MSIERSRSMEADFKNYDLTEVECLELERLDRKRMMSLQLRVQQLQNSNELIIINQQKQERKIDLLQEEINRKIEKDNYLNKHLNGKYVNLTSLGEGYHIGSQYMGELLRKVGIARRDFKRTVPKSEYKDGKNPLSEAVSRDGNIFYTFHYDRTWALTFKKLKDQEFLNKFLTCKNQTEVHIFINDLDYLD